MLSQTGRSSSTSTFAAGTAPVLLSQNLLGNDPVVGDLGFVSWTTQGNVTASLRPQLAAGWTEIVSWHALGGGNICYTLWAKVLTSADIAGFNVTVVNPGSASSTPRWKAWWVHSDGPGIDSFQAGATADRSTSGSTSSTMITPSLTPTKAPSLVCATAVERTTAAETEAQITVSGTGWVKSFADVVSDQSLVVAYKSLSTTDPSGNCTFGYPNAQATNASGVQIAIYEKAVVVDPGPVLTAPIIKGWSYNYASNYEVVKATPDGVAGPSGVMSGTPNGTPMAAGDWVLVIMTDYSDMGTPGTPPEGWATWRTPGAASAGATFGVAAYYKIRRVSDGDYDFTNAFSSGSSWICIWGSGADPDLTKWVIGPWRARAELADANKALLARAPSITTNRDKSLVITVGADRSAGAESFSPGMPTVTGAATSTYPSYSSFPRLLWRIPGVEGVPGFNCLVTAGSRVQETAGIIADETITFENSHANNGLAAMIAIPPAHPGATATTDRVATAFMPDFGSTYIRVGAVLGSSATGWRLVVSTQSDLSNPTYVNGALSSRKWGTAKATGLQPGTVYYFGFEVDGVLQTDYSLSGRTLRAAGVPASYKFISGSCQKTGSNHQAIATMAAENADFFCHMGDLHYADATTQSAWEAGFLASMTAANQKVLMAKTPMDYIWDNHDRIIVDTLNLGTTLDATRQVYREIAGSDFPLTATQNRTWVSGRVRYIHTDAWTVRDDPDIVAEPRTMFGATQKQWLKDTLAAAPEPLIIWFSSFPNHNVGNGRWNSFDAEVDELEAWLNARPHIKQRLIMLGGDSHDLRADSGTRKGPFNAHNFIGVPSLNISGIAQGGDTPWVTGEWDIAEAALGAAAGSYARCTITDDGISVTFLWEAVNGTTGAVLASWRRRVGTAKLGTATGVFSYWNAAQQRMIPVAVKPPS